ncbi:hypothetical protein Trydic_g23695 [Trypoxylus dichotomus]
MDLTAAYDTVWREGLLLKFLRVVPYRRLGLLLNSMFSDGSFRDKAQSLSLPQHFSISTLRTCDITNVKFTYADNLALAVSRSTAGKTDGFLTNVIDCDGVLQKMKAKNPNKTECA